MELTVICRSDPRNLMKWRMELMEFWHDLYPSETATVSIKQKLIN